MPTFSVPVPTFLSDGSRRPVIAIQGELGSNSHLATLEMLGDVEASAHSFSPEVVSAVLSGAVDGAVLPIENTLYGSVAEHYDLLRAYPLRIERESHLLVRHNLIAAPGVELAAIRTVLSHPVALAQCRHFLAGLPAAHATPFYDTAGSVRHLMAEGLRDTAGIAPVLAAEQYGGAILVAGIEDHSQNLTRFHLLRRAGSAPLGELAAPDKITLSFALEHRAGTLVDALSRLSGTGLNLTRIESRPVPGQPWEYVFYVEGTFAGEPMADEALEALRGCALAVKELGRYKAA